jgi:Sad1 / UNC-like C-terminal
VIGHRHNSQTDSSSDVPAAQLLAADTDILVEGTYSIADDEHIQTFPVQYDDAATAVQRPLHAAVTFEVLSNYGSSDYTCLYRVRVHGDAR